VPFYLATRPRSGLEVFRFLDGKHYYLDAYSMDELEEGEGEGEKLIHD